MRLFPATRTRTMRLFPATRTRTMRRFTYWRVEPVLPVLLLACAQDIWEAGVYRHQEALCPLSNVALHVQVLCVSECVCVCVCVSECAYIHTHTHTHTHTHKHTQTPESGGYTCHGVAWVGECRAQARLWLPQPSAGSLLT
jgi:hypothetical protein